MQQENELYVVYKHTNTINGKMYVGQTCLKLEDRWGKNGKGYEKFWVDKNGIKHPSHFWSAIQKYGWNNFEHKVLIHGLTKSQADFWEKKLIKEWDLMNPQKGYNKREGGSGGKLSDETKHKMSEKRKELIAKGEIIAYFKGKHHTEESKEKIRQGNLGKRVSEESKIKMSEAKKGMYIGENNPMYGKRKELSPNFGKHHTEETKQKIREKSSQFRHSEETKDKISQILKTKYLNGEIVAWNKGKKRPEITGENNPWFGKHHTEETKRKMSEAKKGIFDGKNNPRATKVVRLSDNKIYYTIQECAENNHKHRDTIKIHCNNKNKTGLQEFMYYTDWIKQQKDEQ